MRYSQSSRELSQAEFEALVREVTATQHSTEAPTAASQLVVGKSYTLLVEALDAQGQLDRHYHACVLLEDSRSAPQAAAPASAEGETSLCPQPVVTLDGLGVVKIAGGVGRTTVRSNVAGAVHVLLQDGGAGDPIALSTLTPPAPFPVRFVAGAVVRTHFIAARTEAYAGDEVSERALTCAHSTNRTAPSPLLSPLLSPARPPRSVRAHAAPLTHHQPTHPCRARCLHAPAFGRWSCS